LFEYSLAIDMIKIILVTYGVEKQIVDFVKSFLKDAPNVEIQEREIREIPYDLFNDKRDQYRGDLINQWIYKNLKKRDTDIIIGILDIDAYVPPLNFIFGVASPKLKVCTVYIPRLKIGVDIYGLRSRLKKEVLHELGHLFGLHHCLNKLCVMAFSNSIHDVDRKTYKFCGSHYSRLVISGLEFKSEYKLT